ncbi:MAG: SufD family Fe-S cluster assembly protein [Bacilli bacterium]|nr:SufD family Fe-S cluster assembly protein [Bacilli bacterium]
MNKIIYVYDNNEKEEKNYSYNIVEDTIIYHFSLNSSSKVSIHLVTEGVHLYYYYSNINYTDQSFSIEVHHKTSHTYSEIYNHGVNVLSGKLDYYVEGIVPKTSIGCVCNQENQIINLKDGKSSICPNLLIDSFDVEANHGAYIGKFSEDKLFYLMSRGISLKDSYMLLLNGFLIQTDSVDMNQINDFILEIKKI